MLRSKFKIPQLLAVVLSCGFFILIPFIVSHGDKPVTNELLLYILGIPGVLILYFYFRKTPRIRFDDEMLSVRYFIWSKVYRWASVKDIYLSAKQSFMLTGMEATSIFFDNGDKLNLWEDIYRNGGEMRSFISRMAADKIRDPKPKISSGSLQSINGRRYAGNAFTSLNTLAFIGLLIFFLTSILNVKTHTSFVFPLSCSLLGYLAFGTQMHYFLIDEGSLFIRNHFLPWTNKEFRLEDILEADIETRDKRSNTFRIMTTDFNKHIYAAGSLRVTNWKELMDDFTTIGIPVRDDRYKLIST